MLQNILYAFEIERKHKSISGLKICRLHVLSGKEEDLTSLERKWDIKLVGKLSLVMLLIQDSSPVQQSLQLEEQLYACGG